MKITNKDIPLIAILATLITVTPSIISSNFYLVNGTTESPTNSPLACQTGNG